MSRQQKLNLELKGLITNVGDLSKPPGSTDIVENFDLPAIGFMPQRRGIRRNNPVNGGTLQQYDISGTNANLPFKLFSTPFWGNTSAPLGSWLVAHRGPNGGPPNRLASLRDGDSGSGTSDLLTPDAVDFGYPGATFAGVSVQQSRLFTYNKNSFFIGTPTAARLECSDDVQAIEGDGKMSYAGMPRAPGIAWEQQTQNELSPAGGAGDPTFWLEPDSAVGYRCTFMVPDKQGVWRESAPSGKYIIANSSDYAGFSAGKNAAPITAWQIPYLTNTYDVKWSTQNFKFGPIRIRVYRTVDVPLSTGLPNDEYYLAYEGQLASSEIAAGYTTIIDYTPKGGLGATAYFNSVEGGDVGTGAIAPSQGGIGLAAENDRPPFAMDGAMYQNCAFYVNIRPPVSLTFSIIAVGTAGNVLKAADILTLQSSVLGSLNLTAVAAVPGANQFRIHNTNVPDPTWSVRRTCENYCAAVNKYHSDLTATYIGDLSNPENAGKIYIECNRMQDTVLKLTTSYPGAVPFIQPQLNPGTFDLVGEAVVNKNGVAFSKPNIPDAVPPANYTLVGGNQSELLRVIPTSQGIFFFTTQGIWVCQGNGPSSFVFSEFDPSFKLVTPEMACVLNDEIYAWGQQGIYRISVSGGMQPIDLGIRNYVYSIQQFNRPSVFPITGWAVAQPNWNRVMFWFSDGIDEAHPPATVGYSTRALVYHANTSAWTTYSGMTTGAPYNVPYRVPYLSAVYRQWDGMTFFTSYNVSSITFNTAYLLGMDPTAVNGPVSQTDQLPYATVAVPVISPLQWMATIPNPGGLCHWSDFEYYTQPYLFGVDGPQALPALTNIQVDITSDLGKTTSATVTQLTYDKGRIILATESGYATRQTVKITVSGPFYAFNGFSFLIRPLGGLNTR